MIKICFALYDDSIKSGIAKVVVNLANLLARDITKYEVHILYISRISGKLVPFLHDRVMQDSLNIKGNKCAHYIGATTRIRRYLLNKQIQIFVISGMEFVLPFFIGTRRYKAKEPKVSMFAWEHLNFMAGPKFRLEWIGKRLACKYFDGIINITKKDYMLYRQYSSKARLNQIYNVCRLDENFGEKQSYYDLNSKKIISVGYLAPIKGFDMLIEVAAKVLPQYPEWSWDIYGEGALKGQLQDEIEKANLQYQLHLKGWMDDLEELYHEYSFFVMTSRMEGFGMVLIEAQKNGLPIISFDIPCGPSDTIGNGKNGFLIPPFDVDTMADKISELICNAQTRKYFSEHARDFHEEMCSAYILKKWQDMLEHTKLQKGEDNNVI